MRYDTRSCFNVHSKADVAWNQTLKSGRERKLKSKKRIYSEILVNSPGNPGSQSCGRKGKAAVEGFAEKEGFKPVMKE